MSLWGSQYTQFPSDIWWWYEDVITTIPDEWIDREETLIRFLERLTNYLSQIVVLSGVPKETSRQFFNDETIDALQQRIEDITARYRVLNEKISTNISD